MLPQPLPPLPQPFTFPQFPGYAGGAYATLDNSKARQQVVDSGYLQQPSSSRTLQGSSNQQHTSVSFLFFPFFPKKRFSLFFLRNLKS